jgi:predicted Zn-dependent protease with MMP-like domain
MSYHVSKAEFAEIVEAALEELPEPFAAHLEQMVVEIRDLPSASQNRKVGISKDNLLLGLYEGVPMTLKSVEHSGTLPARIYIFQRNLERVCDSQPELSEQIRKTVLHEIGHYFGMSEEDLDERGYG